MGTPVWFHTFCNFEPVEPTFEPRLKSRLETFEWESLCDFINLCKLELVEPTFEQRPKSRLKMFDKNNLYVFIFL